MTAYIVSGGQTSNGVKLNGGSSDSLTVMSGGTVDGGTIAAVYGYGGAVTVSNYLAG
jgi:hypothetical protein